ncbi:MAG TPA: DUF86 domain-containing protein [Phycisphaerales bacterium]|nr:DUF86 domain-containing protein [Phycisphaerales bacterium]
MLDAARQATEFVRGKSREDLNSNPMLTRALLHAIQEIGEAASKMTDAGRARITELPWPKIVGMRHRLVHGYWNVNLDLVWVVVERDLPPLIHALELGFQAWPMDEGSRQ